MRYVGEQKLTHIDGNQFTSYTRFDVFIEHLMPQNVTD